MIITLLVQSFRVREGPTSGWVVPAAGWDPLPLTHSSLDARKNKLVNYEPITLTNALSDNGAPYHSRSEESAPTSSLRQELILCSARSLWENNGDDHAIETEGLTEDENEDHADEDLLLLSVGSDTSVTDNTNSETSSEGGETASQTGGEVLVSIAIFVAGIARLNYYKWGVNGSFRILNIVRPLASLSSN